MRKNVKIALVIFMAVVVGTICCMLIREQVKNGHNEASSLGGINPSAMAVTTYISLADGDWDASVWSTDGGTTNCGCNPGYNTGSDSIIARHLLAVKSNLTLNTGSNMLIESSGELISGNRTITLAANNSVIVYGIIDVKETIISNASSSVLEMHAGSSISKVSNDGGFLNILGDVTITGKVKNATNGVINIAPGVYLTVNGDIDNDGTINLNGGCIDLVGGTLNNTSDVNGNGMITTTGDIINSAMAFWSIDVYWCANSGTRMPIAENCGGLCSSILPVELTDFVVSETDGKVRINWSTATELNNELFIIERSSDGSNFIVIGTVSGAGNSNEELAYMFTDEKPGADNYYRLVQVDYDGQRKTYGMAYIKIENKNYKVLGPNPFRDTFIIFTEETMDITIFNMGGKIMDKARGQGRVELGRDLPLGTYVIMIGDNLEKVIKH